jgi:N-acetylmuramoyl-L-alanine amidase
MPEKIGYDDYLKMVRDPDTPDEEIAAYSVVVRGESAFAPELRPNPELVTLTEDEKELESAMQIGNGLARFRRQLKFKRRQRAGEDLPILVSEGDSWFQFPVLIKETIDQLGDDYLVWSIGAAGDTLQNMVHGPVHRGGTEYLRNLKAQDRARAFLFSAAGNDIIGEDPVTGDPVLSQILKPFNGNAGDVVGHIDLAVLGEKLAFLKNGYEQVIHTIRAEPTLIDLPILVHGYDYAFPYPWGDKDPRDPLHAEQNAWLGAPLDQRGILDPGLRHNLIKFLIDALYDMLGGIAGSPEHRGVHLVDCRGALPDVADWADEIHGTSAGFAKVADRFRATLANVLA